ncbi:DUF3095 domain-containing protein [Methylobacterium nodulans]|uniref:Adenylate cyclase protein n=1 Tax=Methylobacterium nodulans (strain LMG 21967 / CNCM I-2342 / ORS 2060) TaxID=460265 RepID=B8IUG3_METNO|nr:DUF3095 domain-containing protein [Methylobacterium nodulans]ACL55208.1 conserved hypothetical protein [Methylobacterium nodulans ORS 2060]
MAAGTMSRVGGGDGSGAGFRYAAIAPITDFQRVLDESVYRPVPDAWWVAMTDVVESTAAIAAGRYKAVNFAGAAAIAALRNALRGRDIPFVFGGDGASLLLAPDEVETARAALAATVAWVRAEMGLTLRAALVPVSAIREAGCDLQVARYAPSPHVAYAMMTGGGLAFAERALKRGLYAVPPADGARPDLTGLSCRFSPARARHGMVLSVIVVGAEGADPGATRAVIAEVLRLVAAAPAMGRPLPEGGPPLRWPPEGLAHEVRAGGAPRGLRRIALLLRTLAALLIFRLHVPVGRFSPDRYLCELVANADFQKYDDGLRMTLDCDAATADAIEARLRAAEAAGLVRYGLHRQAAALTTCITPVPSESNHVHFIDGEDGGYTRAARMLKAKAAA